MHRAYGINITASAVNEDIEIFNNNVVVSATGTGRDANALSLQGVDMTTGGFLNIHNNSFTSSHETVRFGGNDGSIVKGVSLFSNTLVQAGTPTVGPFFYGYYSGPYQTNGVYDSICINCVGSGVHNISSTVNNYATSGVNSDCDVSIGWKMSVDVGQPSVLVTATDNLSNNYTGTTNSGGIAEIYVPQYKKMGSGTTCQSSGSLLSTLMSTINYSPYSVSATYNGNDYSKNNIIMDSSKTITFDISGSDLIAPNAPSGLNVL